MTPDNELLRRYARAGSEDAFAELVKRHVNLVYSTALRRVNGDAHLAQDAAQRVFIALARKARPLARRDSLTGWLYTSAHFAAAELVRTESRRSNREEQFMRQPTQDIAPGTDWEKIRPALDDAMHQLKAADREAVLLRYFENRSFADVATRLGLNENAARMRVERALEKLRAILAKCGITTTAALASVISANAVQMAPAGMGAALATASLAAVATGTVFSLLKFMTASHLKFGIGALVVAGAATALVAQHHNQIQLRDTNASLHQQIAQLEIDNESLSNRLAAAGQAKSLTDEQFNDLLRLRGKVGVLREQIDQLETASEQSQTNRALAATQYEDHQYAVHWMSRLGLAMSICADNNNGQYPGNFDQLETKLKNTTLSGVNQGWLLSTAHDTPYTPASSDSKIRLALFQFVEPGLSLPLPIGTNARPLFLDPALSDIAVLREGDPYQTPDGKWERVYAFADGSARTITLDDGNFEAWEKHHLVGIVRQE